MRFQIQEMARVERMLRDEQIAHEIETYNELIPEDGELSCTLFIEITDDEALRYWLPRLTDIERNIVFVVGDEVVEATEQDAERLTRDDDITSTVHYLKFGPFTEAPAGRVPRRARRCASSSSTPSTRPTSRSPPSSAKSSSATSPPDVARHHLACASTSPASTRRLLLPAQQHEHDAGYDLHALDEVTLAAGGGRALVPTGLAVAIPAGLRRAGAAALGARAEARRHVLEHTRAHRRPVPR